MVWRRLVNLCQYMGQYLPPALFIVPPSVLFMSPPHWLAPHFDISPDELEHFLSRGFLVCLLFLAFFFLFLIFFFRVFFWIFFPFVFLDFFFRF